MKEGKRHDRGLYLRTTEEVIERLKALTVALSNHPSYRGMALRVTMSGVVRLAIERGMVKMEEEFNIRRKP